MPIPEQSSPKIRVLCADDHPDILAMLKLCISADRDLECVGCLANANDLTEQVRTTRCEIVILDRRMPGKDPLLAQRELATALPPGERNSPCAPGQVRTIVFSGNDSLESAGDAAAAGAWGYLVKDGEIATLLHTIKRVARGELAFDPPR